jgi:hypothetical protein
LELLGLSSPAELSLKQYSFGAKLKPDHVGLPELIKKYSIRNLTFEKDAMNAFTAIMSYLEPSVPGGFFFGLPEGAFHNAIRWKPYMFKEHDRRNEFPSWSWLGWKGESFVPHDARPFDAPEWYWKNPFIKHRSQLPLVEWHKQEIHTGNRVPIKNMHDKWQSAEVNLRSNFQVDALPAVPAAEPKPIRRWLPFLYGRVQLGKLKIGKLLSFYGSEFPLLDTNDKWCGTAEPTGRDKADQSMYVEGDFCELLAFSQGDYTEMGIKHIVKWSHNSGWHAVQNNLKSRLRESRGEDVWHSIIHALWIRWEDGIAYRQGLCHILAETWDLVDKQEVDIVLG